MGGVLIGTGEHNENASFGSFYEGTIIAGYPDDATDLEVQRNIQAAGYGE